MFRISLYLYILQFQSQTFGELSVIAITPKSTLTQIGNTW